MTISTKMPSSAKLKSVRDAIIKKHMMRVGNTLISKDTIKKLNKEKK